MALAKAREEKIHYGYGAFFPSQKGLQALRWDVHLDVQFIMVIVLGLSLI